VVKAREGVAPDGSNPAVRVGTVAERERAVAGLLAAGASAVVEELIDGDQWAVHAVRGADGTFDAVAARVERTVPRRAGTPSVFTLGAPDHPVIDATRRLFELIGFAGPGNAQFFVRGGEVLVHDVNLRLPASVAMAMRAGLDLPRRGVDAALGRPLPPVDPPRPGLRYVSLGDEIRLLLGGRDGGPPPRRIARDIVQGALSSTAMLDPPLRDPIWIGVDLTAGARNRARRAVRRVLG
jgi:hypothetical protein